MLFTSHTWTTFCDTGEGLNPYDSTQPPLSVTFLYKDLESMSMFLQWKASSSGNVHDYTIPFREDGNKHNQIILINGKGGTMVHCSTLIFFLINSRDEFYPKNKQWVSKHTEMSWWSFKLSKWPQICGQHKYPSTSRTLVSYSMVKDLEGKKKKSYFFIFNGEYVASMSSAWFAEASACLVPWRFSSFFTHGGRWLA